LSGGRGTGGGIGEPAVRNSACWRSPPHSDNVLHYRRIPLVNEKDDEESMMTR